MRALVSSPRLLVALLLIGIGAACSSAGGSDEATGLGSDQPGEAAAETSDDEPGSEANPDDETDTPPASRREPLDLSAGPLIFFGAVPPMPPGADLPLPDGSADYYDLFDLDSTWPQATEQIAAFKLHAWQVRHFIDDEQLRRIVDWLETNDIPLMFETEPLPPPDPDVCDHTESFEGPYDLEMARRIAEFGGTIDVVAIEEPFHFAHLLTGPGACQYPVERVVDEVIDYVTEIRRIFPDVPVGTIEPIWQNPRTEPDHLATWLDTYQERAGEPFAFLHADPEWARADWAETARAIEDVADARGVPFGVLYNGGGETDGDTWLALTMDRIAHYQTTIGGTPDHIVLQSWVDQPDRVLPDDDLGAFTSLINRYQGQPSQLTAIVETGAAPGGAGDEVRFELRDATGAPLGNQPLSVELRPLSGAAQTHTVSGTVPEAADNAVIAIRVHAEDAATGQTDVTIDRVAYRDGSEDDNRVSNPGFEAGLAGWGAYGEPLGQVSVEGTQPVLRLQADEQQLIFIDSAPFPVTPGSDYEFEATLSVPPESIGNATIAVVFLADIEVTRNSIPFVPIEVEAPALGTDPAGVAKLPVALIEPGTYVVEARYAGDLTRWPATATATIQIGQPGSEGE